MSLLDVSSSLPELIRRPGMTSWKVLDNNMAPAPHPDDEAATAAAIEANSDKKNYRKAWSRTLWPNGKEAERGLERCLRLYPHLQDTGAFFVSVLIKSETPVAAPAAPVAEQAST